MYRSLSRGLSGASWGPALLVLFAAICSSAQADPATCTSNDQAACNRAPSIEELEARIRALEKTVELLQHGAPAPAAPAGQPGQPAPATVVRETAASAGQSIDAVGQAGTSKVEAKSQIYAGPSGFSFQSPDGANQIRFHGEFAFDGRFFDDDLTPAGSRSTWLLRRARPIIEGTFANIFDFRFNPDFAGGKTVIQDAFVAARFNPLFIVTAGKFKEPFGLERLQLSPNNRFVELGLPSDLVPNRDLGIQIAGAYAGGVLTYQAGYFDGVNDGTSTDANLTPDVDNNDKKDWTARLFLQPFLKSNGVLHGLGAGFAASYVNQSGSTSDSLLPTYRTETQRSFFSYDGAHAAVSGGLAEGATFANGERLRMSPQAYYFYRRFGFLTEYVTERQDVSRVLGTGTAAITRNARLTQDAWQAIATFLLTADQSSFGTITPIHPFALGRPGWGAFELAARISQLQVDRAAFATPTGFPTGWFANPDTQARAATAWTAGVNWYLNTNVVCYVDYTDTRFSGGAAQGQDRPDERAFFTRFQVAF
jgi:phosphate-selective porin OprO/OprP